MLIFAIDDDPDMLALLHNAVAEAVPGGEILDFSLASSALDAVRERGLRPDVVFSDIVMPPPDGLALAGALKTAAPRARLVFVTGYERYALAAYRAHAAGYIVKPVTAERIREEMEALFPSAGAGRLRVQCFGYFDVFWQDAPLSFSRRKTKELFAFLVDRRGAACTAEEAIAVLYENTGAEGMKKAKQRLRNLVSDMKSTLNAVGMGSVLIRQGSGLAVRTELLDCDYLRMVQEDAAARGGFHGEYMEQYSWAERTKGALLFRQ